MSNIQTKKGVSYNLNVDIIERVKQYQKENKISSVSGAVERLLLKALDSSNNANIDESYIEDVVKRVLEQYDLVPRQEIKKDSEKEDDVSSSIVADVFSNMPD